MNYWNRTEVQYIYDLLNGAINNPIGTAALMGNLYAESGICPFVCETKGITASRTYTDNVLKTYTRSEFSEHNPSYAYGSYTLDGRTYYAYGYGLAQWTTEGRKANYYNYVGQQHIGDTSPSVGFMVHELQASYSTVWNALTGATDIKTASTVVLTKYEIPYDQSSAVQIKRANYGVDVYNDFSGGTWDKYPTGGGGGGGGGGTLGVPIWMLFKLKGE